MPKKLSAFVIESRKKVLKRLLVPWNANVSLPGLLGDQLGLYDVLEVGGVDLAKDILFTGIPKEGKPCGFRLNGEPFRGVGILVGQDPENLTPFYRDCHVTFQQLSQLVSYLSLPEIAALTQVHTIELAGRKKSG